LGGCTIWRCSNAICGAVGGRYRINTWNVFAAILSIVIDGLDGRETKERTQADGFGGYKYEAPEDLGRNRRDVEDIHFEM